MPDETKEVKEGECPACGKWIGHVKHCPYCNGTGEVLPEE